MPRSRTCRWILILLAIAGISAVAFVPLSVRGAMMHVAVEAQSMLTGRLEVVDGEVAVSHRRSGHAAHPNMLQLEWAPDIAPRIRQHFLVRISGTPELLARLDPATLDRLLVDLHGGRQPPLVLPPRSEFERTSVGERELYTATVPHRHLGAWRASHVVTRTARFGAFATVIVGGVSLLLALRLAIGAWWRSRVRPLKDGPVPDANDPVDSHGAVRPAPSDRRAA